MENRIASLATHFIKKAAKLHAVVTRHSGILFLAALAVATFFAPKAFAAAFNVYEGISQYQKAIGEATVNGSQSSVAHDAGGTVTVDGTTKVACGGFECILYKMASDLGTGGNQNIITRGPNGEMLTKRVEFPGAIGSTINLTAMVYENPVASSTEFIADLKENIGLPFGAQKAYAQGLGFSSLRPVLELWRLFRNLAYFFFVVIAIIISFLIMFRSKIGGQTAVTVQQALPKIVISLILVTFSYAIAGLMIDLMYLVMYLIIGIFRGVFPNGQIDAGGGPQALADIAFKNDIFTNGIRLTSVAGDIATSMGTIVNNILNNLGWSTATAGVVSFGAGIIFLLVLIVAIIVSLFRVFFELLKAYLGIFFSVIFAPIQLLIGALPGQNTFGTWLKGLIENLLVFPTLVLLIFIAYFFSKGSNVNGQAYTAPGLGNDGVNGQQTSLSDAINPIGDVAGTANAQGFSAPQLGSNQQGGFGIYQSLLALGAIISMPNVMKLTKGFMSGKLDFDMGKEMKDFYNRGKLGQTVALGAVPAGLGAVAGYKYATDRANSLGLEGRARRLAQLGGLVGGGGVGMNLLGTAKKIAPEALRQFGQAEMKRVAEETKAAADKRRTESGNARTQNVAAQINKDIENTTKSAPPVQATQPTVANRPRNAGLVAKPKS
jgi:hypothetical protein